MKSELHASKARFALFSRAIMLTFVFLTFIFVFILGLSFVSADTIVLGEVYPSSGGVVFGSFDCYLNNTNNGCPSEMGWEGNTVYYIFNLNQTLTDNPKMEFNVIFRNYGTNDNVMLEVRAGSIKSDLIVVNIINISRTGVFNLSINKSLFKNGVNYVRFFGKNINPYGYGTNPPNFKIDRFTLLSVQAPVVLSDSELLDKTEALSAKYFYEKTLGNGLVLDSSTSTFSSIAATGFGLSAFTIMAERYNQSQYWSYTPEQLRAKTNQILDTLIAIQNNQSNVGYGKEGLFYHFIAPDGKAQFNSEVSTIDNAILFSGIITAGEYFRGDTKQKASTILSRGNWSYYLKTPNNNFNSNNGINYQFSHGWQNGAIFSQTWDRPTDESILISVIALASNANSPDFQKSLFSWPRVERSYAGYKVVNSYFGSLFTYEFAHAWIDFKSIGKDKPLDGAGIDWWQNSLNAANAARQFAIDNSGSYSSYGADSWGFSAVQKPNGAYEGSYGSLPTDSGNAFNDGTIAVYSSVSTMPFFKDSDSGNLSNNLGFRTLRSYYDRYNANLWGIYGLKDSFDSNGLFSGTYLGIDQGPTVLMIENYRTGFVWKQFIKNENVKAALKKVFECPGDSCGVAPIVCSQNSQCGNNAFIGDLFCLGNNVARNYIAFTCNNPGTAQSYCSNLTTMQTYEMCSNTCLNGICQAPPIETCKVPYQGMIIDRDTVFCYGAFVSNITFSRNNIVLDCNNSYFWGELSNVLIVNGRQGITIKNCQLESRSTPLSIHSSSDVRLENVQVEGSTGIWINGSRNVLITGSRFSPQSYSGTGIYSTDSYRVDVLNTTLSGMNNPIYYLNTHNSTFENDIIGGSWDAGLELINSNYNRIANNLIANNLYQPGIYLDNSSYNIIVKNQILRNSRVGTWWHKSGIFLMTSKNNYVAENNITGNGAKGIFVYTLSNNNVIINNEIGNNINGISISSAVNNSIIANVIRNNSAGRGLDLYYGDNSTISSNTIDLSNYGIAITGGSNIILSGNNITNSNITGIRLNWVKNSIVKDSWITENTLGMEIVWSDGNLIYNNLFRNPVNINQSFGYYDNYFNISKTSGVNIIGNPYLGGNFWSDYNGSDINGDGLGETSYSKGISLGKDSLPLTAVDNYTIACYTDLDCGLPHPIGQNYCSGNNVVTDYQTPVCQSPGTRESLCASVYPIVINQTCSNGCFEGKCIEGPKTIWQFNNFTNKYKVFTSAICTVYANVSCPVELGWQGNKESFKFKLTGKENLSEAINFKFYASVFKSGRVDINAGPASSPKLIKTINVSSSGYYTIEIPSKVFVVGDNYVQLYLKDVKVGYGQPTQGFLIGDVQFETYPNRTYNKPSINCTFNMTKFSSFIWNPNEYAIGSAYLDIRLANATSSSLKISTTSTKIPVFGFYSTLVSLQKTSKTKTLFAKVYTTDPLKGTASTESCEFKVI